MRIDVDTVRQKFVQEDATDRDREHSRSRNDIWKRVKGDPTVRHAHALLYKLWKERKPLEVVLATLLNAISLAFITYTNPQPSNDEPVVFFEAVGERIPRGDFNGSSEIVDIVSFEVPLSILLRVVERGEDQMFPVAFSQGWARLLSVGSLEPYSETTTATDTRDFQWNISTLKCCRPDLATVHGFRLSCRSGVLRLRSLSACGVAYYRGLKKLDLEGWMAHVTLVYGSYNKRDRMMTPCEPKDEHIRLDMLVDRGIIQCAPFYFSECFGISTWIAFESGGSSDDLYSICKKDCQGAVKVTWQEDGSAMGEYDLLEKAHTGSWLPGLVRHWSCARRLNDAVSSSGVKSRVKEVLHLASTGDPLSQCTSATHALKVFYDLVEVHLQLLRRGIQHDDISWYNVLCNPWHHPDTESLRSVAKTEEWGRSIDFVLTGDVDSKPCVLLVDLDRSSTYPKEDMKMKSITGTPMFIAMELCSRDLPIMTHSSAEALERLRHALHNVQCTDEVYRRAFPDCDEVYLRFFEAFDRVCELEFKRRRASEPAYTNTEEPQRPAHDVESMFWTFVWLFVRALPNGSPAFDPSKQEFMDFCDKILDHYLEGEDFTREKYLYGGQTFKGLMHESLKDFYSLFDLIAAYLSIPWNRYYNIVHPEHAHVAVKILLLNVIYATKPEDDVAFDCSRARDMCPDDEETTEETDELTQLFPVTGQKRKAAAGIVMNDIQCKRANTVPKHACLLSGCNPNSAAARSEKFWIDRYHWFFTGVLNPREI